AREGYRPAALDLSVDQLAEEAVRTARFIGIAVPMHTAMRLGIRVAQTVRALNPAAHLCFYGLYASLNADYLLAGSADSVIGGEYEAPLLALVRALQDGSSAPVPGVATRAHPAPPLLAKIPFALPERRGLPSLDRYAR